MTTEEKQKINVWIPGSLWKQIGSLGYESPTKATIAAFEALVRQETKGSNQEDIGSLQEALGSSQEEVRKYQEANRKLEENLRKAPDLVTFAQLQARYEGLQEIIKEKEKSIERLENDLKKAGQREEDLKNMHNNYMLQIQSLINARALMPSGSTEGEKPKRESKPAGEKRESRYREKEERVYETIQDESPAIKRKPDSEYVVKPDVKQEENTKEVICLNCGKTFTAARSTRLYCSGACKEAYRRKLKKEAV